MPYSLMPDASLVHGICLTLYLRSMRDGFHGIMPSGDRQEGLG